MKVLAYITTVFSGVFVFVTEAVAGHTRGHTPPSGDGGSVNNPTDFDTFKDLLAAILEIVALIALPFVVLAIIYSGFLFVTAQGKPDKLDTAKRVFFWTVVGALAILGASVLAQAIGGTVDELRSALPLIELYA